MALSAAAPIFRGYLCDVDCRWDVISAAVDDRTDEVITEHSLSAASTMKYLPQCFLIVKLYLVVPYSVHGKIVNLYNRK